MSGQRAAMARALKALCGHVVTGLTLRDEHSVARRQISNQVERIGWTGRCSSGVLL